MSSSLSFAATPLSLIDTEVLRKLAARLILASHAVRRERAADVPERDLDAYVALGWMRWKQGSLALTAAGRDMLERALRAFVL